VDMAGIHDPKLRVEIVKRRIAYEQDPDGFREEWEPREHELSGRIQQARDLLPLVAYTDRDLYAIAALTGDFKVDGHRADIVILKAARAHAAYEGRMAISDRDILLAAELALPHRMKRQPFQEAVLEQGQLEQKLRQAQEQARSEMTETTGATEMADPSKKAPRGPNR